MENKKNAEICRVLLLKAVYLCYTKVSENYIIVDGWSKLCESKGR
ncbi:hypothetical protein [Desulfitobacterium hafniense]|nr:hypothetical protein [Desulfitobacterium hafniense]